MENSKKKRNEIIKYIATPAVFAGHKNLRRYTLISVGISIFDDDSVMLEAVSGNNCSTIKSIPQRSITREQLNDLDDDPYDNLIFLYNLFDILEID